jgi:Flp pilus assembly protein TadB
VRLDPTINAVIIVLAGVFIGAITCVAGILDPANADGAPRAPVPFKRGYVKAMQAYDAAQKEARALAPRSYNVALAAFFGLIVVVILGIVLSPVHMQWGWFIGGFFLGFLILQSVYALARTGRLNLRTPEFLERLTDDDRQAPAGR